jgi:hypothetical protein
MALKLNDSFTISINSDSSHKNVQNKDFINTCYQQYKKEYMNDENFSLKSYDMSEEIDDFINEFDFHVKRRHEVMSNSIYSDLLDQIGKMY